MFLSCSPDGRRLLHRVLLTSRRLDSTRSMTRIEGARLQPRRRKPFICSHSGTSVPKNLLFLCLPALFSPACFSRAIIEFSEVGPQPLPDLGLHLD